MRADLDALEGAAGHRFADRDILRRALTHSSHVHEQALAGGEATARDNEQLEFLGDSVLGFLISEDLLQRHPEAAEGRLSKLKAHLAKHGFADIEVNVGGMYDPTTTDAGIPVREQQQHDR